MKSGFTLIEILVVISVVIIVTGLVIADYKSGEKTFALQRSVRMLAQEIRTTKQLAMSAKEIGDGYPLGGYGIYFEQESIGFPLGKIIVFADCKKSGEGIGHPDKKITAGNNRCGTSISEIIQDIELENDIKIKSISPNSPIHIIFKAPSPTIIFSDEHGNELTNSEVIITLSFLENGSTKTVKVNKAGLIEVE